MSVIIWVTNWNDDTSICRSLRLQFRGSVRKWWVDTASTRIQYFWFSKTTLCSCRSFRRLNFPSRLSIIIPKSPFWKFWGCVRRNTGMSLVVVWSAWRHSISFLVVIWCARRVFSSAQRSCCHGSRHWREGSGWGHWPGGWSCFGSAHHRLIQFRWILLRVIQKCPFWSGVVGCEWCIVTIWVDRVRCLLFVTHCPSRIRTVHIPYTPAHNVNQSRALKVSRVHYMWIGLIDVLSLLGRVHIAWKSGGSIPDWGRSKTHASIETRRLPNVSKRAIVIWNGNIDVITPTRTKFFWFSISSTSFGFERRMLISQGAFLISEIEPPSWKWLGMSTHFLLNDSSSFNTFEATGCWSRNPQNVLGMKLLLWWTIVTEILLSFLHSFSLSHLSITVGVELILTWIICFRSFIIVVVLRHVAVTEIPGLKWGTANRLARPSVAETLFTSLKTLPLPKVVRFLKYIERNNISFLVKVSNRLGIMS